MTTGKQIPPQYQTVMPYLIVPDAAGFSTFVQQVFGAEVLSTSLREGTQLIGHSEVRIGGCTIMFCDSTDQWAAKGAGLFIYVDDADTTYREAIEAGAVSVMPPADQGYGRSCGVEDRHGNTWWITSVQ